VPFSAEMFGVFLHIDNFFFLPLKWRLIFSYS